MFHSALLYGGSSNTEVSTEGERGTAERRETIHLRRRHVLLRMMDALRYKRAFSVHVRGKPFNHNATSAAFDRR